MISLPAQKCPYNIAGGAVKYGLFEINFLSSTHCVPVLPTSEESLWEVIKSALQKSSCSLWELSDFFVVPASSIQVF